MSSPAPEHPADTLRATVRRIADRLDTTEPRSLVVAAHDLRQAATYADQLFNIYREDNRHA